MSSNTNKVVSVITFVVVAGGLASYGLLSQGNNAVAPIPTNTSALTMVPTSTPVGMVSPSVVPTMTSTIASFKNGVYTVIGNYVSPAGPETIGVTVTLSNGIVTDAVVEPHAIAPISQKLQGEFIAGFKQYVIGKKIDEVNVGKVSGSSLTPKGFNDAIDKIEAQAKA